MNEKIDKPDDACDNWNSQYHRKIANHETEIGILCDECYEAYYGTEDKNE